MKKLFLIASILMAFFWAAPALAADVTLQWDANTESDLAGYIIYWDCDQSGVPYANNQVVTLDEDENADSGIVEKTITGLVSGTRYWFVVTAYDTERLESGFSNEVTTNGRPSNVMNVRILIEIMVEIP